MNRHYFVSDNIDELENVERELEAEGVLTPQIHVLSDNEAALEKHHLHAVTDFMKTDVIRAGLWGLAIGAAGAALVLVVAYFAGWASEVGWVPFVFFAIVVLGFCTWEGGFLGFQERNKRFRRFEQLLADSKHVLFIDVSNDQEELVRRIMDRHPSLVPAGDGESAPRWVVLGQHQLQEFMRWAP
jgi:hypothetical protein